MLKRFNQKLKRDMVVIKPGEYYVTGRDEVIATVLGSCISVCIRDEKMRIGGMNHFMLPGDFRQTDVFGSQSARYGMYAMEMILGDMIKLGSDRQDLTAKVFGGGHVLNSIPARANNVPESNIRFVRSFLSMEGIRTLKADVGGNHGRKVLFLPHSGKAYVKALIPEADRQLRDREKHYRASLRQEVKEESLTLF